MENRKIDSAESHYHPHVYPTPLPGRSMSDRSSIGRRQEGAPQPLPLGGDRGAMAWLIAAGISIVLIAPAPFFWCPPAWIIYFLSRRPRASARSVSLGSGRKGTPAGLGYTASSRPQRTSSDSW